MAGEGRRAARREVAVRVYTVCQESRYLVVRNVPALGCIDDLIKLFALYGPIEEYRLMDEEDCEPFTDVYWIKFVHIANARFAKRKLDEQPFLGALLKVAYAPHFESLADVRAKLEDRRRAVLRRTDSSTKAVPPVTQKATASAAPKAGENLMYSSQPSVFDPLSLPHPPLQYPPSALELLPHQISSAYRHAHGPTAAKAAPPGMAVGRAKNIVEAAAQQVAQPQDSLKLTPNAEELNVLDQERTSPPPAKRPRSDSRRRI